MTSFWQKLTKLSKEELELEGREIEMREEFPVAPADAKAVAGKKVMEEKKKKEDVSFEASAKEDKKQWLEEEGQLSVDVYQEPDRIIIRSTMAGVRPEDIDIAINNDMVTIRGERVCGEEVSADNYFHRECFWGKFSRSIILPVEVNTKNSQASLKNGILTIILLKLKKKSRGVKVKKK